MICAARHPYDAVIVGGGPAGLSTALVLGRARKRVLVLDTGRPANAVSNGVGGLLGQGGTAPAELRAEGREQLAEHPTSRCATGRSLDAEPVAGGFLVTLERRHGSCTRALVLAHGLRYDPPPLPGIAASGAARSSTVRSATAGRFATARSPSTPTAPTQSVGARPVRLEPRRRALHRRPGPARRRPRALEAAGVRSARSRSAGSSAANGAWSGSSSCGPGEERDALFVRTQRDQPNDLAAALGCELDAGRHDRHRRRRAAPDPGVYAAGDAATGSMRSVANAMGTGSRVAQAVALDLVSGRVGGAGLEPATPSL